MPKIRAMQIDDVEQVHSIELEIAYDPWSTQLFIDCINFGYTSLVLENLNGEILGFCIFNLIINEGHILSISISPKYQGSGLGDYLLRAILSDMQRQGADSVYLEVNKFNSKAKNLYIKHDFIEIGERKEYYPGKHGREDALVMVKSLSKHKLT